MDDTWANFLNGQVSASSALLGLLFVGISLNLSTIIASPALPRRAFLALVQLLLVLVVSLLFLIPGQSMVLMGLEVLVCAGAVLVVGTRIERILLKDSGVHFRRYLLNFIFFLLTGLPYLVAGVLMLAGGVSAPYWLAAGMVLSLIKAVTEAWVLLVEINR